MAAILALWWLPVFVCKSDDWRRRWGFVLFAVNIPLYALMVIPAYLRQPHCAHPAGQIVRYLGVFFLAYGIALTVLHLFPKMKAGGPGYSPACLLTHGVYRYVRHPQIAGMLSISLGFAGVEQALYHLYINAFYFLIFCLHVYMEERFLLVPRFGDQYRRYRKISNIFFPALF